jgi:hypothetical protein
MAKTPDVKTFIPPQAFQYFNTVKLEGNRILPGFEYLYYFGGLIEQESCISLTHSKCWNPKSQLKTSRELGQGFGQLTKAFNKDGTIRFDALTDLRRANMSQLRELSWTNITQRPDLQIRAIVIMSKNNYKIFYMVRDNYERLAMADSAYNGGAGAVRKQRQLCSLRRGCDPQKWFGNLERMVVKSTRPIYGNRSADTINKEHVRYVLKIRMLKYKQYIH